uniref:SnoaL-like domain-containing protein n=1 Tax=Chrysotila carterae TaxID=13221 RepID=A0A6S9QUU1_CHRCT
MTPILAAKATMAPFTLFFVAVCTATANAFSSVADVVAEQQAITAAFNEFGITFFQQDAATLAPFFADDSRAVIFDKVNQETFVYGPGEFEQFAAKDFELMPTLEGFSLVALDVYVNLDVPVRQAFNVALNPTTFEERGLRIGTFFYNADHLIVSSLIAI